LTELVTAGDSLVRRAGVEPDRLIEAASSARGVRGARLARQAAALVRRGVDSPMESRLRLLLVLAGLPEPWSATSSETRTEVGWRGRTSRTRISRSPSSTTAAIICSISGNGSATFAGTRISSARAGSFVSSRPTTFSTLPAPSSPASPRTSTPATPPPRSP